jgi:TolB protein
VLAAGVLAAGAFGLAATSGAAAATTRAATTGVPWSKVGPGWELAEYTAGRPPGYTGPAGKAYPVTLYLISPAGVRYPMHTWGSQPTAPYLIAWSGDKTRALLGLTGSRYEQLTLATGKLTTGQLAGRAAPTGYTLPDGLNILGVTEGSTGTAPSTVARYSLSGQLLKVLTRGVNEDNAVYAANGTALAVSGSKGLELVSNVGGVIRTLPVPNANPPLGCWPARWWNSTTILAQCLAKGAYTPRLWLVPTSGKRPTALTPQRSGAGPDLGDIDAWQLASGTYLQALGGCATLQIFRQAASGSITPVVPAHTAGQDNRIVTALGGRLLIDAQTACPGSESLLWYNPATKAEQWLLRAPAGTAGVIGVIAYNSSQNAPAL